MNPHLSTLILWGLLSIAEAILVAAILAKGASRRWPFLLTLTIFDLLHSAILYKHLGRAHYRQYFYIFWYGHGVRALLSLGLLWDVARSVPNLKYVPKSIGAFLLAFGLAVTVGSVLLTTAHHPNVPYPQTSEVLMMQECVTVAWMCLALSLLGSISSLGMGWLADPLSITVGIVIWGLVDTFSANLMSSWPQHGHVIDQIQNAIEIAVLLSWSVVLCRPPLPDEVLSDSALNVVNELFEEQPLV